MSSMAMVMPDLVANSKPIFLIWSTTSAVFSLRKRRKHLTHQPLEGALVHPLVAEAHLRRQHLVEQDAPDRGPGEAPIVHIRGIQSLDPDGRLQV